MADPPGRPFGIWEPQDRQGAQLVNEASAWALSSLRTNDFEGAEAFYGTLFGWEAEPLGDFGMEVFRRPGYFGGQPLQPVPRDVVAGMIPMDEGDQRPRWELDFWIDGVDAGAERATARGGTVIVAPFDMGEFRTAVLADPGGRFFLDQPADDRTLTRTGSRATIRRSWKRSGETTSSRGRASSRATSTRWLTWGSCHRTTTAFSHRGRLARRA